MRGAIRKFLMREKHFVFHEYVFRSQRAAKFAMQENDARTNQEMKSLQGGTAPGTCCGGSVTLADAAPDVAGAGGVTVTLTDTSRRDFGYCTE